jgi:sterol desaturase/sphingolipid hydroxylase (fatty acid hydroxylase superfamily)
MTEFYDTINSNRRWIALGLLILFLVWESIVPFFAFFRNRARQRITHGATNFALAALNLGVIILLFASAWTWAVDSSKLHNFGLLHRFDAPVWVEMLIAVLLFDLFTYWFHRLSHRIPFMWRFHRVHHSDPHMDVTTANRFHLGEVIISSLLRIALLFLTGVELWHLALYELLMFSIVQFHHANIALPAVLDRLLRLFIVTPAMHKVHHSRIQKETDSNYTSLFSFWDRVFGSFRVREHNDLANIQLGLHGYDSADKQHLIGLLKTPKD